MGRKALRLVTDIPSSTRFVEVAINEGTPSEALSAEQPAQTFLKRRFTYMRCESCSRPDTKEVQNLELSKLVSYENKIDRRGPYVGE